MVKANMDNDSVKELIVETGRHGNIWIDSCPIGDDKDLLSYEGFRFRFIRFCSLVTNEQVEETKRRFRRLKLI